MTASHSSFIEVPSTGLQVYRSTDITAFNVVNLHGVEEIRSALAALKRLKTNNTTQHMMHVLYTQL